MDKGRRYVDDHKHSVCLRDDKPDEYTWCELCHKLLVSGPIYYCDSCRYTVHKSCGDMPLTINHSFHSSHGGQLSLTTGVSAFCESCLKRFQYALLYQCKECPASRSNLTQTVYMDVECAMIPWEAPSKEGQQWIQHFSHPHFLSLLDIKHDNTVKCFPCRTKFSGPAYGCTHCNYFLHKSCAESPQEIFQHPLHPHQNSTLRSLAKMPSTNLFNCDICGRTKMYELYFMFKCDQCQFELCWKCHTNVKMSIKYEDHEHSLFYVERTSDEYIYFAECDGYDAYCTRPDLNPDDISKEFKRGVVSSILSCAQCNFKVHLLCGPLPFTIKHECHIHSLTLHDSLRDDFGEHYCDVCEIERDPRIRVYYCKECKYFAHVHCVISEIINALEHEGVELMALGKENWKGSTSKETREPTTLSLNDLIQKLDLQEKTLLKKYFKWDETLLSKSEVSHKVPKEKQRCLTDEEIHDTLRLSRFADNHFYIFCHTIQDYYRSINEHKLELKTSDLGLKLVKLKGLFIPNSLADVLIKLLDRYGDDIADDCKSSLEMKSILFFILCQVVKRMSGTMVKDVTKHLLKEWYCHLRFVNDQQFKIRFALKQFESLVEVFLGFQVHKLESEIPEALNKKISELRQGLQKCEEFRGSSEKPEYMKYCMNKASELKLKDGFACLPIHHGQAPLTSDPWDTKWFWHCL